MRAGTHTSARIHEIPTPPPVRVLGEDGAAHGAGDEGEDVSELHDLDGHGLGRRHDALDAGWRGAMLCALGLRGPEFQWVQGALDANLTATVAGLSAMADRNPPRTATARLAAGPDGDTLSPCLSRTYRRLLGAVLPEIGFGLRGRLGAAYPGWVAYRNAAPADLGQRAVFRAWAHGALPPQKRASALRLFDAAANDPVSRARDAFGAMQFRDMRIAHNMDLQPVPSYGVCPDTAAQACFPTKGGRLRFDSDRLLPVETGSLAQGGVRRPSMLPALRGDAFDPLELRLATSRITVRGQIGARAVLPVTPGGWYDADLVRRAFLAGPCPAVWDECANAGHWAAFFGPQGTMLRHTAQLVLVSDVQVQWTCAGRFGDAEQARIFGALGLSPGIDGPLRATDARGGGVWPFTIRGGHSAMRARAVFDGTGRLVINLTLPPGRLQLWGVRIGHLAAMF